VIAATAAGEHEAAACIVAVPATVLGRIAFAPELPPTLAETLGSIRYGHAAKLFVPLASPAPPSATLSVPERYWAWTATGTDDRTQPVVSAFAGSPAALERLEVESGPGAWLESLERLRPDLDLEPDGAVLSTWDDDPWAGAAYSLEPAPLVRRELAEPIGRLAFAGEHLAPEFAGLMEGALRSGRHAAARVAGQLG
jgi:monoamine oxidase